MRQVIIHTPSEARWETLRKTPGFDLQPPHVCSWIFAWTNMYIYKHAHTCKTKTSGLVRWPSSKGYCCINLMSWVPSTGPMGIVLWYCPEYYPLISTYTLWHSHTSTHTPIMHIHNKKMFVPLCHHPTASDLSLVSFVVLGMDSTERSHVFANLDAESS